MTPFVVYTENKTESVLFLYNSLTEVLAKFKYNFVEMTSQGYCIHLFIVLTYLLLVSNMKHPNFRMYHIKLATTNFVFMNQSYSI